MPVIVKLTLALDDDEVAIIAEDLNIPNPATVDIQDWLVDTIEAEFDHRLPPGSEQPSEESVVTGEHN